MNRDPLSTRLRESTKPMHRLAERNAFVGDLLRGTLAREAYCTYLRNLHALYGSLEAALGRGGPGPTLAASAFADLRRCGAIESDLVHLHGPGWDALPVAGSIAAYVARIEHLAHAAPHRLAAHAYVRYMGDLSGGQVIATVVARTYSRSEGAGTAFYGFGDTADVAQKKARLRAGIDILSLALEPAAQHEIVEEAIDAFARHVAIFDELGAMRTAGR